MDETDENDHLNYNDRPLNRAADMQSDKSLSDEVQKKAEMDAQRALNETGFGKFNYKIIFVSGMICTNVAFSITNVGFILPSAACDLNMNTIAKGRLSASPIFGMLFGVCMWGCIADTSGRRRALLNCLFLQAFFELFGSIISSYWGFVVFKFLSGLALSGQLAILYTYVGEFQPEGYREKALSFMEIPWVVGMVLAPVIAWAILPLPINLSIGKFSFKSWNLFAAMCSLPALITGFALRSLPETPKYLAEMSRYNELSNILTLMYRENTGKPTEAFIEKLESAGVSFFKQRPEADNRLKRETNIFLEFRKFFITLYEQTSMLLRPPYVGRTLITCIGSYCIFSALYTLMLWFPELFNRFAEFEIQNPGKIASVCVVSRSQNFRTDGNVMIVNLTSNQSEFNVFTPDVKCNSTVENQVYVHTLILGLSCIPAAIIFPVCASRLGFRFYLVFNSFAAGAVTIGLLFVTTSTQNLILSCIYEALMSVSITVVFCISVELFPTNLRVTGSALASFFGRIGALVGNTMFGYLIDDHCLALILIVATELFLAGIVGFFIRQNDEEETNLINMGVVPKIGLAQSASDKYQSSLDPAMG